MLHIRPSARRLNAQRHRPGQCRMPGRSVTGGNDGDGARPGYRAIRLPGYQATGLSGCRADCRTSGSPGRHQPSASPRPPLTGTRMSRLPLLVMGETMPERSICSSRRAARL